MPIHYVLEDLKSLKIKDPHFTYKPYISVQILSETITIISPGGCRAKGLSKVCYMNKMYQNPLK